MDSERLDKLVASGNEALRAGDAVAARKFLMEAIAGAEREYGESSVQLIDSLALLGKATRKAGTPEAVAEAIALQTRALRIAQEHSDPREPRVLITLAHSYESQGSNAEAVELLGRALDLQRNDGSNVQFTLVALTHILLKAGRAAEALPYSEESMKLAELSAVSEDELIAPLLDVGLCLRDAGNRGAALPVFKRAHAIAVARPDVPELRDARAAVVAEIQSWMEELEGKPQEPAP